MPASVTFAELQQRIAAVRENLRDLTEQAAAGSGASDESRADDLIAAQEEQLARLQRESDTLAAVPTQ